jgi:chromosomal replication initiation ATPase DnaA
LQASAPLDDFWLMVSQLIFPIEPRARLTRADFIAAPGNERVLAFLDSYPAWPAPAAVLHGPAASGKSHLAQIWADASGATVIAAAALGEAPLGDTMSGPVVVEDVDTASGDGHERALFALFERGTPLLLTGRTPPATWRVTLPDLASRYAAALAFDLGAPDDALLAGLAAKLFADRQLTVPEPVIRHMIERLARSPEAIRDFVALADARALSEKRPINLGLIRDLLAAGPP